MLFLEGSEPLPEPLPVPEPFPLLPLDAMPVPDPLPLFPFEPFPFEPWPLATDAYLHRKHGYVSGT